MAKSDLKMIFISIFGVSEKESLKILTQKSNTSISTTQPVDVLLISANVYCAA